MNDIYQSILIEIETLLKDEAYEEASQRINSELSMPYLPRDFEEKILLLKKECDYYLADKKETSGYSLEDILEDLKSADPAIQLKAASSLGGVHLASITDELKEFLASNPNPEAAALVIETIANQGVKDTFIYKQDGQEISFKGDEVVPVEKSQCFYTCLDLLKGYLECDYAYFLHLSINELVHRFFRHLPLSFPLESAHDIVNEVIYDISMAMDDGKTYKEVMKN